MVVCGDFEAVPCRTVQNFFMCHAVLVLCDVQCFMAILYCKYYYLGFRNWPQVYSVGGTTHIHNLNNCPRANAFLWFHINFIKIVQTA